eukprot:4991806-Heterocapsa_arctica.AAC.1
MAFTGTCWQFLASRLACLAWLHRVPACMACLLSSWPPRGRQRQRRLTGPRWRTNMHPWLRLLNPGANNKYINQTVI